MRNLILIVPALMLGACATTGGGWAYGDRVYGSRAECLAAKRDAQRRAAVIGAAGGAATGALSGGNLGETALAAGAGALAGTALASARRC